MHPINLALRFVLELAALSSLFIYGLQSGNGAWRWLFAVALPIGAAALWGVFAVPDDPSRGGNAPVPVPGGLRLLLELGIFSAAAGGLWLAQHRPLSVALTVAVLLHYLLSLERIRWLLQR